MVHYFVYSSEISRREPRQQHMIHSNWNQTWRELPTFGLTKAEMGERRPTRAMIDVNDDTMVTAYVKMCSTAVAGRHQATHTQHTHREGGMMTIHTLFKNAKKRHRTLFIPSEEVCGSQFVSSS